MDLQLHGKRALVTGSNSGIGVGIAKALAEEGVAVVVHGRNAERTEKVGADIAASGGTSATAIGDLTTDEGADAVARAAMSAFGGIDILVNNAGGSTGKAKKWFDITTEEWTETYHKNVVAAGRMIHRFAPAMREREWGRIIQISSATATIPSGGQSDYAPAKAAMLNMSLGLSKALSRTGVTVNTISPGMIRTEGFFEGYLAEYATARGWDLEQAASYISRRVGQTVDRIGEPEDVGYTVAYLASPRSGYLNGVNIHLDGGSTPSIS